jgi:hypothetical protein
MPPTEAEFEAVLSRLLRKAGAHPVEIEGRQVYRIVGSYPDPKNHRMPYLLPSNAGGNARWRYDLDAPPKGDGATLRIRYLPRQAGAD